jgi:hypothetical protein
MHNAGRSTDMYAHASYDDVAADVARELGARAAARRPPGFARAHHPRSRLGFAKRAEHTFAALAGLPRWPRLASDPARPSTQVVPEARDRRVPAAIALWGTAARGCRVGPARRAHRAGARRAEMVQVVRVSDAIRDCRLISLSLLCTAARSVRSAPLTWLGRRRHPHRLAADLRRR